MRTRVPRVPHMINSYFQHTCSSHMESDCALQEETRPYVSGFPLGCCSYSTLCVPVITWRDNLTRHIWPNVQGLRACMLEVYQGWKYSRNISQGFVKKFWIPWIGVDDGAIEMTLCRPRSDTHA
jgi:hypothetical protein